jgi:hypothetical protein
MPKLEPQLVFYGTDVAFLESLRRLSVDMPYISYQPGVGRDITRTAKLDAMWAGLMAASELFGANPPFPLHRAIVLRIPEHRTHLGFPKYGITGVAVGPNDPKTAEYAARLTISALRKAVREFNSHGHDQIVRIGILPEDLKLKDLGPRRAFQIIREAWAAPTESQAEGD